MDRLPKVTNEDIYRHFGVQFPAAKGVVNKTAAVHQKKKKHSKKPLPPPIGIDLSKVIFTQHALNRFVERMFKLNPELQIPLTPEELEKLAREIFAGSTEKNAIDPAVKVKRCITHKFQEARYFVNHGWRFVVLEEEDRYKIVTVERVRDDAKSSGIKTMADVMVTPEDENK